MKRILLILIVIVILAGCKKRNEVSPPSNIPDEPETVQPANPEDAKLITSLKITPVLNNVAQQIVKASVTGNQLNLDYAEKVQLLIDYNRYNTSWYVVFNEDFKNTQLEGMDYKMVTQWGDSVQNWKPYNLNQIDKIKTDTLIGGVKVVNIKFERSFHFFKQYATLEEATAAMNTVVGKKESLKFLTRYEPDADTTRNYVSSVSLLYTK